MAGFKRKIFYMGGFDPRGVRHYHALYREAAERWSELTGVPLAVDQPQGGLADPYRLDRCQRARRGTETSYSFPALGGPRPSSLDQEPGEAGPEGSAHLWRADRQFRRGDGAARCPPGRSRRCSIRPYRLGAVALADRADPVPDRAGVAALVGGAGDRGSAGDRRGDAAAQEAAHAVAAALLHLQCRDRRRRDRPADDGPARGVRDRHPGRDWMAIGTRCSWSPIPTARSWPCR